MPKFEKEPIKKKKKSKSKSKKISDEKFMMRSVKSTAIIAGIFLILSLIFNGTEFFFEGIIVKYVNNQIYWEIIDYSIKSIVIILAFLFMMISLGNYKELIGKPVDLKEILFLFGLALLQTVRSLVVFILTLCGLILILFYLYLIQEN